MRARSGTITAAPNNNFNFNEAVSADTGDGDGVVVGGLLGYTISLAPTESGR
jgi:hypothetical protein